MPMRERSRCERLVRQIRDEHVAHTASRHVLSLHIDQNQSRAEERQQDEDSDRRRPTRRRRVERGHQALMAGRHVQVIRLVVQADKPGLHRLKHGLAARIDGQLAIDRFDVITHSIW